MAMPVPDGVFVHPNALLETSRVGRGTRIWAFAHVLKDAVIGKDCNICDHVFIENDVVIGDEVTVKCGVQLWDGVHVEDKVFIGPNVTFTNDPFPRSRARPAEFSRILIKTGASIGANATILPGLTIGRGAMVGAGSVVTRSVPPNAVVVGNPARIVRYTSSMQLADGATAVRSQTVSQPGKPEGVRFIKSPQQRDLRGSLVAREVGAEVPFVPQRSFLVFDVPTKEVRGEHAHKTCHQFLVAVRGSVHILCDDGREREEFFLDSPTLGLYMPPMVWGTQYQYTADAVLLVLASHHYDPKDYIRDYETFLALKQGLRAGT